MIHIEVILILPDCILIYFVVESIAKGVKTMTTVSVRLDDKDKKRLDKICSEMGMSLATFFNIYAKKVIQENKIPFEITAQSDPFFSESNMSALDESEQQYKDGKVVVKTMEELETIANA